jgi:hypothetical protein
MFPMIDRFLASVNVLIVPIAGALLMTTPVAGQRPAAGSKASGTVSKAYTPPRTPDGQPDLQGFWNFQTLTPLERPREFGNKEFLTVEEATEFEAKTVQENTEDVAPRSGDTGTYNQFWFDYGTKVVPSRRTSLIIDPRDGRMPALTSRAQQKRAAAIAYEKAHPSDTWVDRGPNERCLARPMPRMTSSYKHGIQVLQVPGYVVLHYEYLHDTRIIPLDGRPHLDRSIQQWNGDSRGHWEGNTLVIDSTNFSDQQEVLVRGTPGLDQGSLHLTERITRVAPDLLNYQATFDDPATWTKPWTLESPWHPDSSLHFEDACHEGNHSIVGILAGARAVEEKSEAKSR